MKRSINYILLITFLVLLITPLAFSAIQDDMISYWTFDNKDTNNNTSINIEGKINGTIKGANINQTGKIAESYYFNGENNHVELGDRPELEGFSQFTTALWFNANSWDSNGFNYLIGKSGSNSPYPWMIRSDNDGNFEAYLDTTTSVLNPQLNPPETGRWHHIILTYNGTHSVIYINGSKVASDTGTGDVETDSEPARIATDSYNNPPTRTFDGRLDEIAIWNRSLNYSEIGVLYNRTKDGEYNYLNNYKGATPLTDNFSTGYGSTNFSAVSDITDVSNMTLAVSNSRVNWNSNVNAKGKNYDKHVKLSQGLVSVNSSALDSSINSSATVTLDVDSCSSFDIYKNNKPVNSLSELKSQGTVVGDENGCSSSYCGNVSCSSGELTYDVQHFSSTGSDSTSSSETVPEFSTYTLLLAVAITILGFYAIRK